MLDDLAALMAPCISLAPDTDSARLHVPDDAWAAVRGLVKAASALVAVSVTSPTRMIAWSVHGFKIWKAGKSRVGVRDEVGAQKCKRRKIYG